MANALKKARRLVAKQAEDDGLWFVAKSASEAYLQQELRKLHEVIEGKTSDQCAVDWLTGEGQDWPDPDDGFDEYGLETWEEPPLYPEGNLAGMTPEQLIAERDRQNNIHDCAVDRCEEINSPTIETAAARSRMCTDELKRRGYCPWADEPQKVEADG